MTFAAVRKLSFMLESLDPPVLPFFEMKRSGRIRELTTSTAEIDREYLIQLLWPMLSRIRFDEEYYRAANKDLRDAEERNELKNLFWHYVHFGFFENRLPCLVEVDGTFYARNYPDIAVAIIENRTPSCQAHFEMAGFAEGRLPRSGWHFADLLQD